MQRGRGSLSWTSASPFSCDGFTVVASATPHCEIAYTWHAPLGPLLRDFENGARGQERCLLTAQREYNRRERGEVQQHIAAGALRRIAQDPNEQWVQLRPRQTSQVRRQSSERATTSLSILDRTHRWEDLLQNLRLARLVNKWNERE